MSKKWSVLSFESDYRCEIVQLLRHHQAIPDRQQVASVACVSVLWILNFSYKTIRPLNNGFIIGTFHPLRRNMIFSLQNPNQQPKSVLDPDLTLNLC